MAVVSKAAAIVHYNQNAPAMQNQEYFYNWVTSVVQRFVPRKDLKLCDVGAGTGTLIAHLRKAGYSNLKGVDFSQGCVNIARQVSPEIEFSIHDIEVSALSDSYDVITMTTVIDFLSNPSQALLNLKASLSENGLLLVNIRNRLAYWPWYHLRHFTPKLGQRPRLQHWFSHLTTPLGMRRCDQPYEKVYSPAEARKLLRAAGLQPIAETGMMFLPMFWIFDMKRLYALMQRLDRVAHFIPANKHFYQYMFVCRAI